MTLIFYTFMNAVFDFFSGKFSHEFWSNRLCIILVLEFLGTLFIAWLLRPIWLGPEWNYLPFTNFISGLGQGRMQGNPGAWVFLIGFCLFPVLGTAWNAYLFRQFWQGSTLAKIYAVFLAAIFEFSLINVSFVGIFDGAWPEPELSMIMHFIGATFAFLGHTVSAVILFLGVSIIYWRAPTEKRNRMRHPAWFLLVIVELVGVYLLFRSFGGPFWQWMIMFSLIFFVISISRLFPEDILPIERVDF